MNKYIKRLSIMAFLLVLQHGFAFAMSGRVSAKEKLIGEINDKKYWIEDWNDELEMLETEKAIYQGLDNISSKLSGNAKRKENIEMNIQKAKRKLIKRKAELSKMLKRLKQIGQ